MRFFFNIGRLAFGTVPRTAALSLNTLSTLSQQREREEDQPEAPTHSHTRALSL